MWKSRKFIALAVLTAVVLVGSIAGVVYAQEDDEEDISPRTALLERVADKLGIDPQQLKDAFTEVIDEMQAEVHVLWLEKAVEENPDIVQAYSNLINAYLQKEDVDKAIEIGEKLVEKAPDFALGYNNLAFAYYCRDEYDKAIEHMDKAVALGFQVHPDFVEKLQPYRTK